MLSARALRWALVHGVAVGCALSATRLPAELLVAFDQPKYFVNGPGDQVEVSVLIDGLDSTPALDPVHGGLFSFAVRATFDSGKAKLDTADDIDPVAELTYFGFSAGAFEALGPGFAAVKGNIRQQTSPLEPYVGSLLAKITLTNLAAGPDAYPLRLEFFRTVGPNEQFFLDGAGSVLDPDIEFVASEIVVVPEPPTVVLLLLAAGVGMLARCRRADAPEQ
ncbi:MAG: PEP-CTERM sorting domain-containing protein [Pirellulales bacterium]